MIYQVRSTSVYGGVMTWDYKDKHDAQCKVRELKDLGGMFMVKLVEIPVAEPV